MIKDDLLSKFKDINKNCENINSTNCDSSTYCENCENLKESYKCFETRNGKKLEKCVNCKNCYYSKHLENCNNCLLCKQLYNKQQGYWVLNKEVSKEEFEKALSALN